MSDPRPVCGLQPGQPDQTPSWSQVFTIIGVVSSAVGVLAGGWKIIHGAAQFSLWGLGAVGWAGIAGAVAAAAVVGYMYYARCRKRDGAQRCWAGAVNHITTSFDSGWDNIFPSGAMHPCVDVVLKPAYWDIVAQGAGQIDCSRAPSGVGSPLIHSFFHSDRVCAAALGATIGAAVGVGVVVALAIAIGAACATVILCLVALLVAAIIGAIIVLTGAALGGAIGRTIAGSDEPTTSDDGAPITVGQLLTVNGTLITMDEFDLTNCGWWVTGCCQHGSVQAPPDYDDSQASQLDPDACSMPGVIV